MPQHAAARQTFPGDHWCLGSTCTFAYLTLIGSQTPARPPLHRPPAIGGAGRAPFRQLPAPLPMPTHLCHTHVRVLQEFKQPKGIRYPPGSKPLNLGVSLDLEIWKYDAEQLQVPLPSLQGTQVLGYPRIFSISTIFPSGYRVLSFVKGSNGKVCGLRENGVDGIEEHGVSSHFSPVFLPFPAPPPRGVLKEVDFFFMDCP